MAAEFGVEVDTEILEGDPAAQIMQLARLRDVDLIVLGSRNRGPLVAASEVGDPQSLRIQCRVNGESLQEASTADMIFGVAELVAYVSETITLEPGDVIATGTPPGVAFGRPDGRYLQDGDTVEVEIERIGVLVNPVVAG